METRTKHAVKNVITHYPTKAIALIAFLLIFLFGSIALQATNYYWIGGSGNWSQTSHWSLSSGGPAGSSLPTYTDNVYFDANSGFAPGSNTVNVDPADVFCKDMDWTGAQEYPNITGSGNLQIYGSLKLIPTMSFSHYGYIFFRGTSPGKTITTAGATFSYPISFSGIGGGWTIQDALYSNSTIRLDHGTLNTNGKDLSCYDFFCDSANTRSLILGSSHFYCNTTMWMNFDSLTFDAGTSTLSFPADGYLNLDSVSTPMIFYNLEFTGNTNNTGNITNYSGTRAIFNNITFAQHAMIYGDNTVNGTLRLSAGGIIQFSPNTTTTLNGNIITSANCGQVANIQTQGPGSPAYFRRTTGTLTADHVFIRDIQTTGGGTFIANNSIDGSGNSGWTFNAAAVNDLYWINGAGSWSDTTHWSTSSGGLNTSCIPGPNTNVHFDANSFFSPNETVTLDVNDAYCRDMDWTGVLQNPMLGGNYTNLRIFGSLTFDPTMFNNFPGYVYFQGPSAGNTITCAGSYFYTVYFSGSGAYTLLDDFTAQYDINFDYGTLNTNGKTITVNNFYSNTLNYRTLNLSNSTLNINYSMQFYSTNLTLNGGTSSLNILTNQNIGFYNWGTAPASNIQMYNVSFAGPASIYGNNTINGTLSLVGGNIYTFESNRTTVMNGTISVSGSCGHPATIKGASTGTAATFSRATGTFNGDMLEVIDIAATGGATFNATNSTGSGIVTGWNFTAPAAVDYYWIGGAGNWSDAAHWSASSGGPAGTCIPGSENNVYFDANSGFTAGNRTVTINSGYYYLKNMDWTGATASPVLTGGYSYFYLSGSLTLIPTLSLTFNGSITFTSTTTGKTVKTAGVTMPCDVYFNGNGGDWTLLDNLTSVRSVVLYGGTFNSNNKNITCESFQSSGQNPRTINLGSSTITVHWSISMDGSSLTMNAGTSKFIYSNNYPNAYQSLQIYNVNPGFRLYDVRFNNTNVTPNFNYGSMDSLIFHDVYFTNNAYIYGKNVVEGTMTLAGGKTYQFEAGKKTIFVGNLAVTSGCGLMATIQSNSPGTANIFYKSSGTLTVSDVSLTDNAATGGAIFTANNSLQSTGVTGWNFTTPVITDLYWISGSGSWSDPNHWSLTSGGAAGVCIPGPNTNVHFNAASGFTPSNRTVTVPSANIFCHDMDWTGAANNPILTGGSYYGYWFRIYGSLTFIPNMTYSVNNYLNFEATTTGHTVTSAGVTFPQYVTFSGIGGGWTLLDALNTSASFNHTAGTLNTNGQTVTCSGFSSNSITPRTLNLGNSTINPNYQFMVDYTNLTLNTGTSTINFTNLGGGSFYTVGVNPTAQFYNIISNSTSGTFTIINYDTSSSTTFNNITLAGSSNFWGKNTINGNLSLAGGMIYSFEPGKTTTLNGTVTVNGNCSQKAVITTVWPAAPAIFKRTTGTLTIDNVLLNENTATGGATFIANNSVAGSNVTGWTINATPVVNYYWVGGSGNWSDLNHWSLTSGGTPVSVCVPGRYTNVRFDANSGFTPGNANVFVDIDSAACRDMDWTGATDTPHFMDNAPNLHLIVAGSLKLISAMTFDYTGNITFTATTTGKTITSAGHTFAGVIYFAGNGGEWILQDAFNSSNQVYHDLGTFNTNNQIVNVSYFGSWNSGSRNLILGSSVFTSMNGMGFGGTGLSINPGTSLISLPNGGYIYSGVSGNNLQFYNVDFPTVGMTGNIQNYSGTQCIFNKITFADNGIIWGDNVINGTLTLIAGKVYQIESGRVLTLNGTVVTQANCGYTAILKASTPGWSAFISRASGTLTANYLGLSDNKATGGATFIANNSMNFGNVSGWTINTATATNLYWVGGSGNWKDPNHWSATSGGTPAGCIPTPTVNVFFNAASGLTSGTTMTIDTSEASCRNMDWTGVNMPTFNSSDYLNNLHIYGSLKFSPSMTYSFDGRLNFDASTTGNTITTAGHLLYQTPIFFNGTGGWTLQDAFTSNVTITHNKGTWNTNGKTVTCNFYNSISNFPRSLILGNSLFQCQYTWQASGQGFTFDAGTSTLSFMAGAYNWLQWFNTGGTMQFYNVEFLEPNNTTYIFNGNNGQTYPNVPCPFNTISCSGNLIVYGELITNTAFNMAPGKSYTFESGRTQVFNGSLNATGNGAQFIDIKSTTPGSQCTFSKGGSCVMLDYINLSDCKAIGGASFYAGANSNNLGNNSGWSFITSPGCGIFWTGTVSTSWNTAGNWSNNAVPGTTSDIIIPGGTQYQPTISTSANCNDITIMSGGVVTISPLGTLTAKGTTSLGAAQCLVLKSDVTGTASFIDNGTITGAGTAKAERYLKANDWHYVSKPVTAALASVFNGQYVKKWTESNYSWVNIISPSTAFALLEGYAIKSGISKTYTFTGSLNTGNLTKSLTRNTTQVVSKRGWNLVGNPYPSSIDWDASTGWTKTNINNAIYIYNTTYAQYATYIGGLGTNGGSRYIAPEQGFFIICNTSPGGTLGMNNNVRVHSNAPFMKTASEQDYVRLTLGSNGFKDEIIVRINNSATTGFDGDLDALKIPEENMNQLWSQTIGDAATQYAINSLPDVQNNPDVPVYFKPSASGTFTITASEFESLSAQTGIWLEDVKTGIITDLIAVPEYQFSATPSDQTNRFILHFNQSSTSIQTSAASDLSVLMTPNPNSGRFALSAANEELNGYTVKVFDLPGKCIFNAQYNMLHNQMIDLGDITPGSYYLKVTSAGSTRVFKFMVVK
ncbi:MAG: T9SS type A sorting domain-containing protein [Bacteroidota bacterium]